MSTAPLSRHTVKQLKFLIPGLATTYYLDTHARFSSVALSHRPDGSWARSTALASLAFGAVTITLFLYILLVPWFKGLQPNYKSWRESGFLSKVIPALTASIILGYSLLTLTLGRYARMGYLEGLVAATGLYALIFGLVGLIPAPKVHRS